MEHIIVGDVHGTRVEFNDLLDKINYDRKKHRVILLGDILDRGEDPIGLLHQIQEMKLECVLANHESKALRWRKYELRKKITGEDNPMKTPVPERKKEWESLSKFDLQWIANLPYKINIKDNWYAIHGGMEPCKPFALQDPDKIIRVRYVDKNGKSVRGKKVGEVPADSVFWADAWNQPYNLIFGHHGFDEPKVFKNKNNTCIGIDTRCVFGGALTAYNLEKDEFIQVKARKAYYSH